MSRNAVRWLSACNLQEPYTRSSLPTKAKTPSGKLDIPLVYKRGSGTLTDLDLNAIGRGIGPGAQKRALPCQNGIYKNIELSHPG